MIIREKKTFIFQSFVSVHHQYVVDHLDTEIQLQNLQLLFVKIMFTFIGRDGTD
ncbi:hypothetical protein HanXRQr2_Chr08g0354291 [Helianthus annuus]|uniref:Uncharacterized protein n=1 Tax=Helianthus annuus TaxID=4232 RepID=A0A9K3NDZ6_HELAN|nr:hypothetical protein HanXRQr2_Chr08g0354291 [Helianthus annuus]KAJ0902853.1 hypothetical protein HanPSC8_Chr08g0342121 [Helianthus annuus]